MSKGKHNISLKRPFVLVIALLFCLPLAAMNPVMGASRANLPHTCHLATNSPTIDGVLSAGEWAEANSSSIIMNGFNVPANQITATWYYMNDRNYLYIALEFPLATDFLVLDFDNGADHIAQNGGEDYATVTNSYSDKYWSTSQGDWLQDTGAGGTTDGTGKRSADTKIYEVKKPLNSGDIRDMTVTDGDTVGFRIETYGSGDYYRYHTNTVDHDLDASGSLDNEMFYWVDLITADAPPNQVPTLANARVTPTAGNTTTTFTYSVNYTDLDHDATKKATVLIDGAPFDMTASGTNFTSSVPFTYSTKLAAGTHSYQFNFSDGFDFVTLPITGTFSGPSVSLSSPPILENGSVDKPAGLVSDTFKYSVVYKDINNDPPIAHQITIDGLNFNMTSNYTDYTSGVLFTYSTALSVGVHTYHFRFTDVNGASRLPISGERSGPNVSLPNKPPKLDNGTVTPQNGSHGQPFTYSVDFSDPDGDVATFVRLLVGLENRSMSSTDGKHFTCTTLLPMEPDGYAFIASDGEFTVRSPQTGFTNGPKVWNEGPVALFSVEPSTPTIKIGQTIKLNGSASNDPDGDLLIFKWSSDKDGELGTNKVIYANLSVGNHSLRLTVIDIYAAQMVSPPYNLTVMPLEPKLSSSPPNPSIKTPQEGDSVVWNITISNTGEAASLPTKLDWLVDGIKVKNTTISAVEVKGTAVSNLTWKAQPGKHTVSVIMDTWFNLTTSITVIANKAPVAKIVAPVKANTKQLITFNGSTSSDTEGKPLTYKWNFGDLSEGTGSVVTHAYKKAGKYTVTLIVTDELGVNGTSTLEVTVKAKSSPKGFIPGFEWTMMTLSLAAVAFLVAIRRRR